MISAMKLAILASAGFAAMASATTIVSLASKPQQPLSLAEAHFLSPLNIPMQHVNHGCIVVDDTPICQTDGKTTVNIDAGFANIYGRFDSNELSQRQVPPGCTLQASWPTNYGDIYYGNDACLYDATGMSQPEVPMDGPLFPNKSREDFTDFRLLAQGNNIGGQCCVPGTSAPGTVQNPYIIA